MFYAVLVCLDHLLIHPSTFKLPSLSLSIHTSSYLVLGVETPIYLVDSLLCLLYSVRHPPYSLLTNKPAMSNTQRRINIFNLDTSISNDTIEPLRSEFSKFGEVQNCFVTVSWLSDIDCVYYHNSSSRMRLETWVYFGILSLRHVLGNSPLEFTAFHFLMHAMRDKA